MKNSDIFVLSMSPITSYAGRGYVRKALDVLEEDFLAGRPCDPLSCVKRMAAAENKRTSDIYRAITRWLAATWDYPPTKERWLCVLGRAPDVPPPAKEAVSLFCATYWKLLTAHQSLV